MEGVMSARSILAVLAVLALCTAAPAQTVDGRDYRTLDPAQPTSSPGKIEVIEFFSYGCPHCNEFYPLVNSWSAKLPKDVAFRRVATGFGRTAWTNLAKTYYALEATGDLAKLDGALLHAIHEEHQPLFDQKSITSWVAHHGVDVQKFATAFASYGVNTKLNQAEEMVERYQIEALPSLAVDGKYVVLGTTFDELLTHTNQLIVKVRAENKATATASTR
jgi:protein dithiol oxidoreductase (disulfide-forming)